MVTKLKLGKILVVDEDQETLDLLEKQILAPLGYQIETARDGGTAIQKSLQFGPDLIVASLTLPGLSGKDLLVALRSQGAEVPMIVTAPKGMEADAIQAFRLGARDYLVKPFREAEFVAALERVVKGIQLRREHRQLAEQLAESNRQLERRVRELTTLFGLGKTVTSTTHQGQLFAKLIEGSLYITEADFGWVLVKQEGADHLVLRAEMNLPGDVKKSVNQPWDDGISSLVLLSGEALALHGEGLAKSKLAQFSGAAIIAPVTVKDQPIGVISVGRRASRPFTERQMVMLEAVADYASISLVNARLFEALEDRAQRLEREIQRSTQRDQIDGQWLMDVHRSLRGAQAEIASLMGKRQAARLSKELGTVMHDIESVLDGISEIVEQRAGEPTI
jgi:two-component system NtrC family sensor kinase